MREEAIAYLRQKAPKAMLSCQKEAFSLPDGLHYLNCAYMSPLSKSVEEAGVEAMKGKRNPTGVHPEDFFSLPKQVKSRFSRLIGSSSTDSVSLLPSVSYGIATAARNLTPRPGQNIVVLHEQFPSNIYTWMKLAEDYDLEIRTIFRPNTTGSVQQAWNEAILSAIDDETLVAALPIVHWTDGTLFDMASIAKKTRETGAALVLDGTQSIGALPFNVADIRPDALIVAGYKWLFGPYSCGFAWWGDRFLDGMPLEENWINRRGSENFAGLVDYETAYQPGATRFDVGEKSNFFLMPMLGAALDQVLEWTPEGIQAWNEALLSPFEDDIREMGFGLQPKNERGAHLFGLRMPAGVEVAEVRTSLADRNVSVSVRGTAIRVAPNVYNNADDMTAFVDALRAVIRR